jgi:hypothetical protein
MNNMSIQQFGAQMARLWAAYAKPEPSIDIISVYYDGLKPYAAADVHRVFNGFAVGGSRNPWPPTLPEIIAELPAGAKRIDYNFLRSQLIKPTCAVGALACARVGSHDIKLMGDIAADRSIKDKLNSFLDELPELTREATQGRGFKKSDIKILMSEKYRGTINMREFAGLPVPDHVSLENQNRARDLIGSGLILERQAVEPADKLAVPAPEVASFINGILSGISVEPKPAAALELKPCGSCGKPYESILNICPQCKTERKA